MGKGIGRSLLLRVGLVLRLTRLFHLLLQLVVEFLQVLQGRDVLVLDNAQVLGKVDDVLKRLGTEQGPDHICRILLRLVEVGNRLAGALTLGGQLLLLHPENLVGKFLNLRIEFRSLCLGGGVRRGGRINLGRQLGKLTLGFRRHGVGARQRAKRRAKHEREGKSSGAGDPARRVQMTRDAFEVHTGPSRSHLHDLQSMVEGWNLNFKLNLRVTQLAGC